MMALGGLEIFSGALIGGLWLVFIGLFLRSAAMSEYQGTIIGHLLHGILSLSQVRNCSPEDRAHKKVADIMRALDPPIEIPPQVSAMDAVHKMNEAKSGRLVVVDNGKLVGLITNSGVMRFMQIRA
jgi:predicted transcriptional regulator